jgi:CRISPR/Cas system-associated endonuclease/helicase Cas3
LDVSFQNLIEDVLSPESTLQRIGRCDRWGNLPGHSEIIIYKQNNDNRSEYQANNTLKDILYTRNLSDLWFDFLLPYNGSELTLDELYVIYNSFTNKKSKQIRDYITKIYGESRSHIKNIYPIKFNGSKESIIKTAGGNKLRTVNNKDVFFIVRRVNSDEWVGVFSENVRGSFDKHFKENSGTLARMKKTMKKLRDNNDMRFSFNDIIDNKYVTLDEVRRLARKSNTPYIRYDYLYDEELGLIKN